MPAEVICGRLANVWRRRLAMRCGLAGGAAGSIHGALGQRARGRFVNRRTEAHLPAVPNRVCRYGLPSIESGGAGVRKSLEAKPSTTSRIAGFAVPQRTLKWMARHASDA